MGILSSNIPLKLAQQEGYFAPIRFEPVVEFNTKRVDRAIAARAVERLRLDRDKGHILMARVEDVNRAKAVYEIYSQFAEFNPVQLHTGIKSVRLREEIPSRSSAGRQGLWFALTCLVRGLTFLN